MGKSIAALAKENENTVIVAGVDIVSASCGDFPVYNDIAQCTVDADVVIDFSHKNALSSVLSYCQEHNLPAVIATTGHDAEHLALIEAVSARIPVFKSANMSIGINLLADLIKRATAVLGDAFDIEIVEKHHGKKLDAPSGTALLLADEVASIGNVKHYVYDRHAVRKERDKSEIGIHAVRGGTIIGDHEVIFAGYNEVLTLSHSAQNREVFASGALRAAVFMANIKTPGLYDMNSLIKDI